MIVILLEMACYCKENFQCLEVNKYVILQPQINFYYQQQMENNIDQTLEPDLGLQNAAQQMNDNVHEQPKDLVNHVPDQA